MKPVPYRPTTIAHGPQLYRRRCTRCANTITYGRGDRQQEYRGASLLEWNRVVYVKCSCGQLIRTRLKPMSAQMSHEASANRPAGGRVKDNP